MTARCYSSPPPSDEDFVFPSSVPRRRIKVRCRCGMKAISLAMAEEALDILRRAHPDPTLVVGSYWCRACKTFVKVTARAMHIA